MSVKFDGKGFKAEEIAAVQFNGSLVVDLALQYKDVDVIANGKKISVKDQLWSSGVFKSIQVELGMVNTRNGATTKGCYHTNESDFYCWRVSHGGVDCWYVFTPKDLKGIIDAGGLKSYTTTNKTEEYNRKLGRYYDRTTGVVIPLTLLSTISKKVKVVYD